MGVEKGRFPPNFQRPLEAKMCASDTPCFRGTRTCSRSSITMPSSVGLVESFFACLSVCLSVCSSRSFERQSLCAVWSTETNDFDAVGHGKVCRPSCACTFSDCCQLATPQNAEVQKRQNLRFSPPEGDTINRSRRNLASKSIPLVCYSTPSLALIRKGSR